MESGSAKQGSGISTEVCSPELDADIEDIEASCGEHGGRSTTTGGEGLTRASGS